MHSILYCLIEAGVIRAHLVLIPMNNKTRIVLKVKKTLIYECIVLCAGARQPASSPVNVRGRELNGPFHSLHYIHIKTALFFYHALISRLIF